MAEYAQPQKKADWDVGVRQTVAADRKTVWAFLVGEGLPLWLGKTSVLAPQKGATFETDDDISGRVLSVQPGVGLRITWQPGEWSRASTLQLTLKDADGGTAISFHQEKLSTRDERKMMLGRWKGAMLDIEKALTRSTKQPSKPDAGRKPSAAKNPAAKKSAAPKKR
ncbi:SRPBCC domain-containing protein [Agreia sp. COWG]|uniref:SRPBCC family protein n=1 Tax=Agreia sp. COWG TaxID=2773266 RepID=UPI0019269DAC|nr:SRPBCC domain-containing protein [Agreia sp. COWG]CAD5990727.1 Activator of Hsp90 ATPase 1 family protein [Agreia sp. COWG]